MPAAGEALLPEKAEKSRRLHLGPDRGSVERDTEVAAWAPPVRAWFDPALGWQRARLAEAPRGSP